MCVMYIERHKRHPTKSQKLAYPRNYSSLPTIRARDSLKQEISWDHIVIKGLRKFENNTGEIKRYKFLASHKTMRDVIFVKIAKFR